MRSVALLRDSLEMTPLDRYLHFENIDMEQPDISSRCSECGRAFTAIPRVGERVDDVLLRIRADFNAHECEVELKKFA